METSLMRVYLKNWDSLKRIKCELEGNWGRKATFADAINHLIKIYEGLEAEKERTKNETIT